MKKILLTLALAAFAFTANAQFVIGGNIGANHENVHSTDYVAGQSKTNITIMPKFGYWLNDKMQIGLQVGYTFNYARTYTGDVDTYTSMSDPALATSGGYSDWKKLNNPTITIAPYFRYNFASWKNFTIFAEAQVALGLHLESTRYNSVTDNTTDMGDDFTTIAINVVPGLNYSFNDHISMDLYVNLFGCHALFGTAENYGGHEWGFGANMGAQSLNAHLNNFSIGFNYSF